MSTYELEAEIAQVAGTGALAVLRYSLDRGRDGRYKVRDSRERLLGDFAASWQLLQSSLRRTNQAFTQVSSSPARRLLHSELQAAVELSRTAAMTLAGAIPSSSSSSRMRECSEYFLNNISAGYEFRALLNDMAAKVSKLQSAIADAMDDELSLGSRNYTTTTSEGYTDSYSMSRGPSSSSRQTDPNLYDTSYVVASPRTSYIPRQSPIYEDENVSPLGGYGYGRGRLSQEARYEPAVPRGHRPTSLGSRRLLAYGQTYR